MSDPIQQVITALNFLVTPNPALNTGSPQPVSTWVGTGAPAAGDGTVYTPIKTLVGLIFSASALCSPFMAPGSSSVVLTSASSLFQQLQQLLAAAGSVEQAAAELAELSQLLTGLAGIFPS